jgi:hypothetical protein
MISTLRPEVPFDPKNEEHRSLYRAYRKSRSWGHSPYRFTVPGKWGITLGHIESMLLDHYTELESVKEGKNGNVTSIRTNKKQSQ